MASYEKVYYCKDCKRNVTVDENGHCKRCGGSSLNISWSTRFRFINEFGKEIQKRITKPTKKAVNDAYIDFLSKNKKNRKIEDITKTLNFSQLYNEYEKYLKTRTKPSTHYDFVSKSKKVLPYFNKYEVSEITPKIILEWQNTLNEYSYQYKCHLRTCLSSMLKYAERYYNIPNQLVKVDNFRRVEPKKEMQIWSPEEFNSVMAQIMKFEYKVFYTALYFTGARKGEIMATSWNDWDFKNKTLTINKSISNKVTGTSWLVTTPKNSSSVRKIKISDNLIELMQALYEIKKELKGTFVFGDEKPLPETCICRYLTNAAKEAKVKIIRIHDLRHSHASFLISQGVSIVAVAKRLGHSSIEQTLNTYAHLMPNEEDDLVNKLQYAVKI